MVAFVAGEAAARSYDEAAARQRAQWIMSHTAAVRAILGDRNTNEIVHALAAHEHSQEPTVATVNYLLDSS